MCGLSLCTSPSLWVLFCLTYLTFLGLVGTLIPFWRWVAPCQVCSRPCQGTNALFCRNFGLNRGGRFDVCLCAWCGACYTSHPADKFHIQLPTDEEGFSWLLNDEDHFSQARNSDHLMTPFQCDWCLFRLDTGRIPRSTSRHDEFLMCVLRRCNLDAFWGREPSMFWLTGGILTS